MNIEMEHSMWAHWPESRVRIDKFRGEGDYLAQLDYGMTPEHYRATYDYVKSIDENGYLNLFQEDGAFGAITFNFDGKVVSRDLLDSILEIAFLQRRLGYMPSDPVKVLDVGAGYGRFAHRFTRAFPASYVYCVDAIDKSTRICRDYLRFRGCDDKAVAMSWAETDWLLDMGMTVDLAVNIHAWSECTRKTIETWLRVIHQLKAQFLFLVPHTVECLSREKQGSNLPFLPVIYDHGFNLIASEPKFPAGVNGAFPTQYFLFRAKE